MITVHTYDGTWDPFEIDGEHAALISYNKTVFSNLRTKFALFADLWEHLAVTKNIHTKSKFIRRITETIHKLEEKCLTELKHHQIDTAIQRRFTDMPLRPVRHLNSILDKQKSFKMIDIVIKTKPDTLMEHLIYEPAMIQREIREYFENLVPSTPMLDLNTFPNPIWKEIYTPDTRHAAHTQEVVSPIILDEYQDSLRRLSSWKSAGLDGIPFGVIKQLNTYISPLLIRVFNLILQSGIIPDNLLVGIIYPIPKKAEFTGHLKDIRPIMLLSTIKEVSLCYYQ